MDRQQASVHAPGPPTFELHTLGWRSFQDLCAAVLREVWGQSVQPFADTQDAGRDGAFYGLWHGTGRSSDLPDGPFVVQCKFIARRDQTLSLSGIQDELSKIRKLVSQGICQSYVLITNARVTGSSEQAMRKAIADEGVAHPLVLGGQWLNQTIAMNQRLRMFVPRVYGLGDLSHILDERAYTQARALLDYLQEDLSTFVVTDAYRRADRAISDHGFCLLLGEPAVGKSVIAATLAMSALDQWSSLTIRADGPEDIVAHWNPNEPNQFFWVDDAFGSVRHDGALTEGWARRMTKVMAAVNGGAKIVLTSRDYIYREARPLLKEYAYPLLHEYKVVINVEDLSEQERQQIVYNHIRLGDQPSAIRRDLKPQLGRVADYKPFRPEVVRRLGRRTFTRDMPVSGPAIMQFISQPNGFLQDVFQGLDSDLQGALAVVYQAGELAAPFEVTTNERTELLTLMGSSPSKVNSGLRALEGTFLRCAAMPASTDAQIYWSFRHPTLREGFASYIAQDRNLLKVFIQGLNDFALLTQLDCGSGDTQGTLVLVPPALYPLVAERVYAAFQSIGQDDWRERRTWSNFLAHRCSKEFLDIYLDIDPDLVNRSQRVWSYLSAIPQVDVLAKLHQIGRVEEGNRLRVLEQVSDLAVETPDSGWLNIVSLKSLFSDEERSSILERVRRELVPNLDQVLQDWMDNEQGGSVEDYYGPLEEALIDYKTALKLDGGAGSRLQTALNRVKTLKQRAAYWTDDDEGYPDSTEASGETTALHHKGNASSLNMRDVFDDVDE